MNDLRQGHKYFNPRLEARGARRDAQYGDASLGRVRWSPRKSLWIGAMYLGTLGACSVYFSWSGLGLFLVTSAVTLCGGHSIGMHRKLIHNSFDCPGWLEKLLVYLGTLVGLGGPFTMTYTHDIRDWAQRQSHCHDYFAHRQPMLKDAWWQMHCEVQLERPPHFTLDDRISGSRFYRVIEGTDYWQQLPWALLFFLCGGVSWVLWGICARVAVSVTGHWLIGYFAHNTGRQRWLVEGACVQGFDVDYCGLITFGECWHNNHHAFPGSAKLGLYPNQADPGWWVLRFLAGLGLVSNLRTPECLPPRAELRAVAAVEA